MAYSIREMASLLGVSKSQVQRARQAGMPMEDADRARLWRRSNLDVGRSVEGRIDRPEAPQPAALTVPPAEPDDDGDAGSDTAEYRRHRTERERLRMEREQLELDRDLGLVIDLKEAQRLAFTAFRALRDKVMNVPARVKDECAAKTDPLDVEQLLEAELGAALAVDPQRLLNDADDEADDEAV